MTTETLVGGEFGARMTLDDYIRAIGLPSGGAVCMKMIMLSKLRDALIALAPVVRVAPEIAERARLPIERMVAISGAEVRSGAASSASGKRLLRGERGVGGPQSAVRYVSGGSPSSQLFVHPSDFDGERVVDMDESSNCWAALATNQWLWHAGDGRRSSEPTGPR